MVDQMYAELCAVKVVNLGKNSRGGRTWSTRLLCPSFWNYLNSATVPRNK
jgi:hypothetical protein